MEKKKRKTFCWFFSCSCCFWWSVGILRVLVFIFIFLLVLCVGRHIRRSEGEPVHIRKKQKKRKMSLVFILLCMHTRSVSLVFSSPMRVKKLVLYDGPPTRFVWTERLQLCALDGYPVGKKKKLRGKQKRKKEGNPTQTQKTHTIGRTTREKKKKRREKRI